MSNNINVAEEYRPKYRRESRGSGEEKHNPGFSMGDYKTFSSIDSNERILNDLMFNSTVLMTRQISLCNSMSELKIDFEGLKDDIFNELYISREDIIGEINKIDKRISAGEEKFQSYDNVILGYKVGVKTIITMIALIVSLLALSAGDVSMLDVVKLFR